MIRSNLTITASLELDEEELRALDALAGYGADSFLAVFYAKLGRHYMQPHEAGLRKLLEKIRRSVPPALHRVAKAKQLLREAEEAASRA